METAVRIPIMASQVIVHHADWKIHTILPLAYHQPVEQSIPFASIIKGERVITIEAKAPPVRTRSEAEWCFRYFKYSLVFLGSLFVI